MRSGHVRSHEGPVEGTAQLVSYQLTDVTNQFDKVAQMQVVVQAEGPEPTAVEVDHGVPHGELPLEPGRTWIEALISLFLRPWSRFARTWT